MYALRNPHHNNEYFNVDMNGWCALDIASHFDSVDEAQDAGIYYLGSGFVIAQVL